MGLLFIISIVIIICLAKNNNSLSNEIKMLKENVRNSHNFCPNCGYALNKVSNTVNTYMHVNNQNINSQNINVNNIYYKKSGEYDEVETKNSLILIIGSILIILSAIIFLTSTWNITHNFVKSIIIILMLGVFSLSSYIAKRIFNLEKTSNAFYYIALAYIPILLLSIALFELFGKYLSLYGLGKYIYLTFSSFLISGIYYYNSLKKNNFVIGIFSIIFQILGVIFLSLIFSHNLFNIITALLTYNLLLIICYRKKKIYYNTKLHLRTIHTLTISLAVIYSYIQLYSFFSNIKISIIIIQILLLINSYYLLVKIYNRKDIYNWFYPILIIIIFYSVSCLINNAILIKQISIILAFISIYLYEYLTKDEIHINSYIEILVCFLILYIVSNTYSVVKINSLETLELKGYILLSIFILLNTFNYIITNKYKLLQAFILTISLILLPFHFMGNLTIDLVALIISSIAIIFIISSIIIRFIDKYFKASLWVVGHWLVWFFTLIVLYASSNEMSYMISFVIYGIYTSLCYYGNQANRGEYLKISSYIYFNIVLIFFFRMLDIERLYIIPLSTLIIVALEYLIPKLKSHASDVYIIIQFILSFILLTDYSIINFLIYIVLGMLFIYYIHYYKKNTNYNYIPMLLFMLYIYESNILIFNGINYMYIISIVMLFSLIALICYSGKNIYIVLFYIYTFFHITSLENIKYVSICLLIAGTFATFMKKNNKIKDLFKLILYIFIFVLYLFIIDDLNLDNITTLSIGSYLILLLTITRTILKKHDKTYKIKEYLGSSIINLIALFNYASEFDGIIYLLFLTGLVIISYSYKYGPIFLICLISILINVFILTKEFWFSIPWWLYILLIGSILVGFAIYNEAKEKKTNTIIKNSVNNIKNNLDL